MKCIVTGNKGFIGGALVRQLITRGHTVSSYPIPDADVFFHFGSPSSNILFNHALDHAVDETISGFLNAVRFCKKNSIKLIYPSSATVYTKTNNYSHIKAVLEEIHGAYGGDILGLRIFTGYGVGEAHKGEYASIAYQFCQQMKQGIQPVIYGDGNQTRDFVYIEDIVDEILMNLSTTGLIDIGTGVSTSFNRVVELINGLLQTNIHPRYIEKPVNYIEETICLTPIQNPIDIEIGLKKTLELT